MFCPNPNCISITTSVLSVRQKKNGKTRRRVCPICNLKFTTEEILLVKDGHKLINPFKTNYKSKQGTNNPGAILTETNVRQLRFLYRKGKTQKELSILYGMSLSQIHRIIHRINWRHI
jgi:hypothetical protein